MTDARTPGVARFPSPAGALALAALIGCSPGTPTAVPAAMTEAPAAQPRHLADRLGARCADAAGGRDCIVGNVEAGDYYDIELFPPCDAEGFFAGVSAPEAVALDTLPVTGSDARPNATLAQDQFLCVQAIARSGQQPAYYYAIAIAPEGVSACRDAPICERYGERPVRWEAQARTGVACNVEAPWQGDCARGWIEADVLEAFSDGIAR